MRALVLLLLFTAAAHAEDLDVAVVPFTTTDEDVAIFGKPVADAVAGALDERKDVAARVAAEDAPTPHVTVTLAIARKGKKVLVTAEVVEFDGAAVTSAKSKPVAVGDLDRAATQVAKLIAPKLDAVAAKPRKERPKPKPVVVEAPRPPPPPPPPRVEKPKAPVDTRPALAVYIPDGRLGAHISGPMVHAFVERLGHRPVHLRTTGSVPVGEAGRHARDANAKATLMVRVVDVEHTRRGVLTARGEVRVRMVDPMGAVIFDRTVETDTVVGSKGDLEEVVTSFVLRQGLDILQRDVRKVLAR